MQPITVQADTLRAALVCASTEETRYYLKGVLLDPAGFAVGLDGHRMFVAKLPQLQGLPAQIIVPRDKLDALLNKMEKRAIEVTLEGGPGQWSLFAGSTSLPFTPVDGTFPDWTRVVPDEVQEAPARYNPKYYADFGKMAKILGCSDSGFEIHQSPDSPGVVQFIDLHDCFAVIMPIRAHGMKWSKAMAMDVPKLAEAAE